MLLRSGQYDYLVKLTITATVAAVGQMEREFRGVIALNLPPKPPIPSRRSIASEPQDSVLM